MARIAVAGGTGAVGKTFVAALSNTKHEESDSGSKNVKYVKVDYFDIDALVGLLESNKIDTILSAISMHDSTTSTSQLNLIQAAEASSATKRFIPSEFGVVSSPETVLLDPYSQFLISNAEALAKTKLQYTRISTGSFLDYWGMPRIKTALKPFQWALDVENGRAAIPGTGKEKFSVTYTEDVAKFIVRLLDEQDWPEKCAVVGQDVTFDQLIAWLEEATGKKFRVTYDSVEKLRKGEATPLNVAERTPEEYTAIWAGFGLMVIGGLMLMPEEQNFRLNERFPDLDVLTAETMIREVWGRRA